jgi:molybdopterin biosynthesis enzyme MoaB
MELKLAIVTCSSTRSLAEDTAGAALAERIVAQGWQVI